MRRVMSNTNVPLRLKKHPCIKGCHSYLQTSCLTQTISEILGASLQDIRMKIFVVRLQYSPEMLIAELEVGVQEHEVDEVVRRVTIVDQLKARHHVRIQNNIE